MLDTFITSRVRRKIIVVYAKYPDFKTHVRGLAKLIKEDAGNIQRELKRMEKIGFLISERQGNTKVYYTNKHFPIFKELQSIVLKSQRMSQKRQQLWAAECSINNAQYSMNALMLQCSNYWQLTLEHWTFTSSIC